MIRVFAILAAFSPFGALAVSSATAQAELPVTFERGFRHRCDPLSISCWTPKGLRREKDLDGEYYYYDHEPTGLSLGLEVYTEHFETWSSFADSYPSVETLRERRVAGRAMRLVRYERKKDDDRSSTIVSGAVDFGDAVLLVIVALDDAAFVAHAGAMIDWIADTLRGDGAAGLDPFLDPRRIDLGRGLWYRPANEFEPHARDGVVWAGVHRDRPIRAEIVPSSAASIRDARKKARGGYARSRERWRITEDRKDRELLVSFHTDRKDPPQAIAIVVAEFGSNRFVVRVEGPATERPCLTRTAEFLAWGLEFVDLAAARRDVDAATARLVEGTAKRDWDACRDAARTLAKYAYLEPARAAVRDHLIAVKDDEARIAMLGGLSAHAAGTTDCVDALVTATRAYASRRNEPVLAAALGALGSVRSRDGALLLLRHLQRTSPPVLIAALRSLARYRSERGRIVAAVVKAFAREDSARKAPSVAALERWEAVEPVFKDTLEALTEKRFETSADAAVWWKANRTAHRS